MSEVILVLFILLFFPISFLLNKFFFKDKQLLIMINVMIYSLIVLAIGMVFQQAIIICGVILEIGIILIYCYVYPFCLKIIKRFEFKHFGTLCWYIFPSIMIYVLSTYAIVLLTNDAKLPDMSIANNIKDFASYLTRINETVGFGFIVNAIFQYFNDNKESEDMKDTKDKQKKGNKLKNGK